jgi:type 1 fimbria pilin
MSRLNFLKRTFTGAGRDNTPEGALIRAAGKDAQNVITLDANNTSQAVNCFELTGSMIITYLHFEVVDATTLNNCTNIYFDLWDGTNSVPLCKVTGASISGFGVNSFVIKDGDVSVELVTLNNDQVRISEPSGGKTVFQPFLVTCKAGATNYIRFRYTTTDTPINAQLDVGVGWNDNDGGTLTPA